MGQYWHILYLKLSSLEVHTFYTLPSHNYQLHTHKYTGCSPQPTPPSFVTSTQIHRLQSTPNTIFICNFYTNTQAAVHTQHHLHLQLLHKYTGCSLHPTPSSFATSTQIHRLQSTPYTIFICNFYTNTQAAVTPNTIFFISNFCTNPPGAVSTYYYSHQQQTHNIPPCFSLHFLLI